jgi:hypothetical protein
MVRYRRGVGRNGGGLVTVVTRMDGERGLLEEWKGNERATLTVCSIQTWALEEARRRLEAEGILPDPDVKKD